MPNIRTRSNRGRGNGLPVQSKRMQDVAPSNRRVERPAAPSSQVAAGIDQPGYAAKLPHSVDSLIDRESFGDAAQVDGSALPDGAGSLQSKGLDAVAGTRPRIERSLRVSPEPVARGYHSER